MSDLEPRIPGCYRPLDHTRKEIRVLSLLGEHDNHPGIQHGTFNYICLEDSEICTYVAVSWCWGEVACTACIYVDGHLLKIPKNALEVIESMCLPQRKFRVWIDAVCINQDDLDERAQQVSMMDHVYRRAREVVVWLGHERSHTQSAMSSLQRILKQCRESRVKLKSIRRFSEHSDDPLPSDIDWPAVVKFFSTAWFERLWCLQEVMLAQRAICFRGEHQIAWDDLLMAARWMLYLNCISISGSGFASKVLLLAAFFLPGSRALPLTDLFQRVQISNWRTTDPRDQIYAVLGLAAYQNLDPSIRKLLDPNYRQPLSRVYADATRAAIMQRNDLSLLNYCHDTAPASDQDERLKGFPSWVPKYHFRGHSLCSALSSVSFDWTHEVLPEVTVNHKTAWDALRVHGMILDDVGYVTEPMKPVDNAEIIPAFLAEFWNAALRRLSAQSSTLELAERAERFLIMLLANRHAKAQMEGNSQGIEDFRKFVEDCLPSSSSAPPWESTAQGNTNVIRGDHEGVISVIYRAAWNRRFFISKAGRLGMAHPNSQIGDKICILPTLRRPYVMRQKGGQWLLIGDTYLEDAMDDKAGGILHRFGKRREDFEWFEIV